MEKHQHPFDDFLKEALKGHQLVPREKARKAFLDEASTIIPARRGWKNWYYLPILVVFISGLITVSYFQINNETAPFVDASTENNSSSIVTDTLSSSLTKTPTLTSTQTSTNISNSITEREPARLASSKPSQVMTAAGSKPIDQITDDISIDLDKTPEDATKAAVEPQNTVQPAPFVQNNPLVSDPPGSATTASSIEQDTTIPINVASELESAITSAAGLPVTDTGEMVPPPGTMKSPETNRAKPASYFTAAVCYLPELMFNTVEGSKFVNNFSIEGAFYRGLTSIRTGLGISVSQGITENSVQYNEFLGTYNKLDSITFIYNEAEHDFYPNLHMSTEQVWDSNTRLDSTKVTKRYTYLQVPLVLGFDFWQRDRFTIGVRIGTIMSVMLSSKQLTGEYDPGENMVVGIDGITPEQVNINWQAIGGFNASVRLNSSLYLEIEPQARYYYQSIYEKSGITKKPWSVGVRLAVTYKF